MIQVDMILEDEEARAVLAFLTDLYEDTDAVDLLDQVWLAKLQNAFETAVFAQDLIEEARRGS